MAANHLSRKAASTALAILLTCSLAPVSLTANVDTAYADDDESSYSDDDDSWEPGIDFDDPAYDEPDENDGEPPILQSERAAFEKAKAAGLPWKSRSDPHTWVYENGVWVPYDTYPVPVAPTTTTSAAKSDAKAKSTARTAVKKAKVTTKKIAGTKKAFTLSWKKLSKTNQARVTGFQVQYATSAKFKGAKTKTLSGKTKTSAKVTGLKAKTTYYVRVRPYKTVKLSSGKTTKVYGCWSKKLAVKVK